MIDNTLIDRDGLLIPDAGWFWDHAEERNKIAQDYLFANYVCTSGKHYLAYFVEQLSYRGNKDVMQLSQGTVDGRIRAASAPKSDDIDPESGQGP